MDILSTFGERLEEMMFECGLSSYDVAGRTNIDVSGIRRYLRKASLPNLFNALKLADLFACSLDYLFGRTDDSYKTKFLPCPDFSERFKEVLQENNCTRYRLNKDTHIAERCIECLPWKILSSLPIISIVRSIIWSAEKHKKGNRFQVSFLRFQLNRSNPTAFKNSRAISMLPILLGCTLSQTTEAE